MYIDSDDRCVYSEKDDLIMKIVLGSTAGICYCVLKDYFCVRRDLLIERFLVNPHGFADEAKV